MTPAKDPVRNDRFTIQEAAVTLSQAFGVVLEKHVSVSLTCNINLGKYLSQLDTVGNIIKEKGRLCC